MAARRTPGTGLPARSGPVGPRPRKAALVGAAVGAVLLVGVPGLMAEGSHRGAAADADGSTGPAPVKTAEPYHGKGSGRLRGVATGSPGRGGRAGTTGADVADVQLAGNAEAPADPSRSDTPAPHHDGPATSAPSRVTGTASTPATEPGASAAPSVPSTSPAPKPTQSAPAGRTVVSFAAAQCITGSGKDGRQLEISPCSATSAPQHWEIRSDGTIRTMGLCMDAAGAGTYNGTVIQVAYCNGGEAQHFVLNSSYDLVNVNAHKCVALEGAGTGSGTGLELRDCNGKGYEKWRAS
ncbi:ricin-type beta-trefoil lectin domain protein [Streptomyces sp. NPDC093970]|uniref:ricin-type beta-trefoil lectin domain protein n=1 Tax=Streptomyces sp. NPDC093970 TaxID=3155076 RepID=UPI00342B316F